MKIKVSEANNLVLDYLVAKIDGIALSQVKFSFQIKTHGHLMAQPGFVYSPTSNWAQGGPIIEREKICVEWETYDTDDTNYGYWSARMYTPPQGTTYTEGETALIAAMRSYVASKLGDEVEIPDELLRET
jgi:hypothetical protein